MMSQDAVAKFQAQMAGHNQEWALLISRVQAFLTSQSLLATGAALLITSVGDHFSKIIFFCLVGLVMAIFSSIAIAINCKIIRRWHIQIQKHIEKNKNVLDGYFMPRRQPDFFHLVSTDILNIGLCLFVGASWMIAFANAVGSWMWAVVFLVFIFWIAIISYIYASPHPSEV